MRLKRSRMSGTRKGGLMTDAIIIASYAGYLVACVWIAEHA